MAFDGNTIHFVTDKWLQPSIKDSERDVRNSTQASYQIKGPEQKRPSNWTDSMKNPNFKIALKQVPNRCLERQFLRWHVWH